MNERNHVPSFESLLEKNLVVDTIEVATTWDHIDEFVPRSNRFSQSGRRDAARFSSQLAQLPTGPPTSTSPSLPNSQT